MNTKKIIAGVVGVLGLSALGYYVYSKSKSSANINVTSLLPSGQSTSYLPGTNQATTSGFPDKSTLLRVAQESGWPAGIFNAINSTYNVASGTANDGDWKMTVIGVNPLVTQWRKGATEQFKLSEGKAASFKGFNLLR